ncbi:MAG: hypothetical protein QW201_01595 [Thermoproteota archaeon]
MKGANDVNKSYENKPIFEFLVNNSSLTKRQILALLTYRKGMHLQSLDRKTRLLGEKVVRKGTYYRVLGQAKKNAIRSFFTMILLHHLNIIDDASWSMMAELSELLKTYGESTEISDEKVKKLMKDVILAFDKMLSIKE